MFYPPYYKDEMNAKCSVLLDWAQIWAQQKENNRI